MAYGMHIKKDGEYINIVQISISKEPATAKFTMVVNTPDKEAAFPVPQFKQPYDAYNYMSAIMEYIRDTIGPELTGTSQILEINIALTTLMTRLCSGIEMMQAMTDEIIAHNKSMTKKEKPHASGLKIGDKVKVFCMTPLPGNVFPRASKTLGEIVAHDNPNGMAVMYQGEAMDINAFKLEVVEGE